MHSGIYTAYSGLKAQMEALDILAGNLANINTTGFKEQKAFTSSLRLAMDSGNPLEDALNTHALLQEAALDLSPGSLLETRRDLDVALIGDGFLTLETPAGVRYTRNGNLVTDAGGILCTSEGFPVLGEQGRIVLGAGKVDINQDGEIFVNGIPAGRLKIAAFDRPVSLLREGSSLLAPADSGQVPKPALGVTVRQGFQEQSNVNPVLATVRMVEIMRHFESIQKSISLMLNDMDAKAIERLPR